MGLEGTIAKEIGNLSSLRFVDISNNSINGQIPSEIGLLGKLQGLNLSHNYLSGDIPTSLSPCVQLKMLDLSHNNLTGTVPAGFGNWSQLQDLSLSRNYLTGDFGISKILSQEERMLRSRTLGTIGYIAPEYGSQGLISTTVDVYSYGILLMETFSRRKPTDEMFSGELTLRRWVSESFPDSILQILDNELLDTDGEEARAVFITCLTSAIGLALECTAALPEERPSTRYVLKRMRDVQSRIREIEIKLNDLKMSFLLTDSDREEIRKSARRWRQIRWKAKQRVPILARIPESQEVVNFEPSETESSN